MFSETSIFKEKKDLLTTCYIQRTFKDINALILEKKKKACKYIQCENFIAALELNVLEIGKKK